MRGWRRQRPDHRWQSGRDGAGALNPGAGGSINIAATLTGTNVLTNGSGQAGTVSYPRRRPGFTGPMLVNGGTILQCHSQTNLGANPAASFNAAQLTLDNGISSRKPALP